MILLILVVAIVDNRTMRDCDDDCARACVRARRWHSVPESVSIFPPVVRNPQPLTAGNLNSISSSHVARRRLPLPNRLSRNALEVNSGPTDSGDRNPDQSRLIRLDL